MWFVSCCSTDILQAIQASDGKDFLENGRMVRSGFFDADKFEQGMYE